jgi:7,8-dihydropterin-6-yl-methyl-4-(beta-D-ribofuranosyl)aminobenzene 5'-phosphate synthase
MEHATLTPVDSAEVTILVDGFVDVLMAGSDVARRAPLVPDLFERNALRAEHGYALLLTVVEGGRRRSVLYDAGLGHDTALHNLDVLGMAAGDLRAIVLSHGHADHHGGLEGIVRRVGRRGLPLVLHPDAWRQRRVVFPTGGELRLPPPSRADLEAEGVEVVEERGPSLLLDGTVLVSGQTERVTSFERGFPIQEASTGVGAWEPDPWVWDDQSVIVDVRGLGLVVLSSCSHSGAVNVLRNAGKVTAQPGVHAFVGGLHLSGALFEPIIPDTIAELAAIAPDVVVPGHCTGWRATHELARAMPDAYVQTGVGTTLHFGAGGLP